MYKRTSDCESKSVLSLPNNEIQYQQLSHTYLAEHHCRVNYASQGMVVGTCITS